MRDGAPTEVRNPVAPAPAQAAAEAPRDPLFATDRQSDVRLQERTRSLDLELALDAALHKYALHISLERQERALLQRGRKLSRAELWEHIELLSHVLRAPYRALGTYVTAGELLCVREQTWSGHKAGKRFWALCLGRSDAVFYRVAPSQDEACLHELLGEFRQLLVFDDYQTYQHAQTFAAHARRLLSLMPVRQALWELRSVHSAAGRAFELIDALLDLEADLPEWQKLELPELREKSLAYVQDIRSGRSEPLRKELAEVVHLMQPRAASHVLLRHALEQLEASGISGFVQDPQLPLCCETVVRTFSAVAATQLPSGLKNLHAAEIAAVFLSLIDSAKCAGVEPTQYVRAAAEAATLGKPPLLPHQYRAGFSIFSA